MDQNRLDLDETIAVELNIPVDSVRAILGDEEPLTEQQVVDFLLRGPSSTQLHSQKTLESALSILAGEVPLAGFLNVIKLVLVTAFRRTGNLTVSK